MTGAGQPPDNETRALHYGGLILSAEDAAVALEALEHAAYPQLPERAESLLTHLSSLVKFVERANEMLGVRLPEATPADATPPQHRPSPANRPSYLSVVPDIGVLQMQAAEPGMEAGA